MVIQLRPTTICGGTVVQILASFISQVGKVIIPLSIGVQILIITIARMQDNVILIKSTLVG